MVGLGLVSAVTIYKTLFHALNLFSVAIVLAVIASFLLLKGPAPQEEPHRAEIQVVASEPPTTNMRPASLAVEPRPARVYETTRSFPQEIDRFASYIVEASEQFGVPQEIIAAVILQESGGDPLASASSTSARGLMQTIHSTFNLAKTALAKQGIIVRTPFSPKDSIFAGTWYLADCFRTAREHFPYLGDGSDPKDWEKALQYYYVGPALGRNAAPMVKVRRGDATVYVDKARYARGILARSQLIAALNIPEAG